MAEGLIVVDDSGRWLLRNPAASRVGGLADDLRALMSSSDGGPDPLTLALTGETVRDRELEVVGPKGQGRILAVSSTPLPPDPATGRARALLIFRDATIEHARRVDLTAFADVVAHDLRNPLTVVESWTEMMATELSDGDVEPGLVHSYVERVGVSSRRMNALIDDLLDRATSSTSALQLRRVDVGALAEEVATDHDAAAQVTVGEIPAVHADPALVRQVVDNLLGNALKFVRDGTEPKVSVTGRKPARAPSRSASPTRGSDCRPVPRPGVRGTPPRPLDVRRARPGPGHLPPHRGAARRLHQRPRQRSRRCSVRVHSAGARLGRASLEECQPGTSRRNGSRARSARGDAARGGGAADLRRLSAGRPAQPA